jgi:hypothetical protein
MLNIFSILKNEKKVVCVNFVSTQQHPFITGLRNKAVLIDLIDRCNEAVAQRGYRFASDDSDDDSVPLPIIIIIIIIIIIVYLFICLFVYLFICLFVYLFIYL